MDAGRYEMEGTVMDRYNEFKEVILSEIREAGNADEATHPVSYGYVLGLKMALSWAAVLLKYNENKKEEKISHKKAEWIDIGLTTNGWFYQCSACGIKEDTMTSFCCGCGARMENAWPERRDA